MNLTDPIRRLVARATLVILACTSGGYLHAVTTVPTDANEVLQKVPAQNDARVKNYVALKLQLAAAPGNADLANSLADAYIDFGRQTGDVRYLGYAEAVLRPWTQLPEVPIPVAVSLATILQSRHDFIGAHRLLRKVVERSPDSVQAWLTLATIEQVQGDLQAANHSCMRSADSGGPFFGIACAAQLRLVTGHPDQGYALLTQIAMGAPHEPEEVKSWVEGLLADAANYLGKFDLADTHFRQALADTPGDNFLLAEYADFLLDQNRPQEAWDLLKDYGQSDTSYLRTAFAEAALNLPGAATSKWTMAARFAALDAIGSNLYQREQSRFALRLEKNPQKALVLALENWSVQRAPWDVRILIEAALAAGKPAAAQPALDFIDQTHLSSVQIDPLAQKLREALRSDAKEAAP